MNKKAGRKKLLVYLLTIFLSALYIFFGNRVANQNKINYTVDYNTGTPQKAKVTQVLDEHYERIAYDGYETRDRLILFEAEFTKGFRKGEVFQAIQSIDSMYAIEQRVVSPGDRIVVYNNQDISTPEIKYMFAVFDKIPFIWGLCRLFCILLLVLGRRNGVNTLVSLAFTIAAIFFVFIPAVLNGGNVYLWSISTCIYIILMTLLIISGISKKSLAAMIGCASGVCVAGIITLITDRVIHLTGLTTEDAMYLLFLNSENPIDLRAIVFAAIILGAVGAIMDVSMSLSSSLAELRDQVGDMTASQITRSGMVVGRDIMGTMANTLILAYIGSSLSVTLLLSAYNNSPLLLFNSEMIIVELLQAVAGSLGILLTIPLTSVICGFLYRSGTGNKDLEMETAYEEEYLNNPEYTEYTEE